MGSIKIRICWI